MNASTAMWRTFREALREPHKPENMRLIAKAYWYTMLACGLIGAILAIGYGSMQLGSVTSIIDAAEATGRSPQIKLDRAKLDTVVEGFAARTSRYHELKDQPLTVPSPSN